MSRWGDIVYDITITFGQKNNMLGQCKNICK